MKILIKVLIQLIVTTVLILSINIEKQQLHPNINWCCFFSFMLGLLWMSFPFELLKNRIYFK